MQSSVAVAVMGGKYLEAFGASPVPVFSQYFAAGREPDRLAALGHRRAGEGEVYLECYPHFAAPHPNEQRVRSRKVMERVKGIEPSS